MTPSLVALLLLIAAGLVVCSALFSGLETALFGLRPHQLRRLEYKHPALAGFVQMFRDNPRRVLAVILWAPSWSNISLIVICLALIWEAPSATQFRNGWSPLRSSPSSIFCDLIPNWSRSPRLTVSRR